MKQIIFALVLIILLSFSCSDKNSENSKPSKKKPEIDLSTPDNSIRSLIRYNDYLNELVADMTINLYATEKSNLVGFFSDDVRDTLYNSYIRPYNKMGERRSIDAIKIRDVDIQSETRAVVFAVNENESVGYGEEEKPMEYRYSLTHKEDKWIVEDAERLCWKCNGTGKETDLENYSRYSGFSKKKCEECNGDGWLSSLRK